MQIFESCKAFSEWLKNSHELEFCTTPQRLKMLHNHLHAIADGDFNPHYCHEDFAKESFFGGQVSHGIAIIARAEAMCVQLLLAFFPKVPIEIIALGYSNISYRGPLRVGELYQYRFKVTGARFQRGRHGKKDRWDLECHITCEVIGENARVVTRADWQPCLVEHPLTPSTQKYLRPKDYWLNIREILGVQPFVIPVQTIMAFSFAAVMICSAGTVALSAFGFYHSAAMDMTAQCPPLTKTMLVGNLSRESTANKTNYLFGLIKLFINLKRYTTA